MVIITWTVDEVAGLAHVLTRNVSPDRWHRCARGFEEYKPKIRPHAPAASRGGVTTTGELDLTAVQLAEVHRQGAGPAGNAGHLGGGVRRVATPAQEGDQVRRGDTIHARVIKGDLASRAGEPEARVGQDGIP